MSQGNVPSFVANIVATEQPLCVANVIKLTKSIADLSQYRDQPLIAAKEPEKKIVLQLGPPKVDVAPVHKPDIAVPSVPSIPTTKDPEVKKHRFVCLYEII